MSDEDLVTQLSELLSGILFETVDPAALNAKLIEDYGANSMDVVDIAERIERKFGITIKNDEIAKLVTFGDVVGAVSRKLADNKT